MKLQPASNFIRTEMGYESFLQITMYINHPKQIWNHTKIETQTQNSVPYNNKNNQQQ